MISDLKCKSYHNFSVSDTISLIENAFDKVQNHSSESFLKSFLELFLLHWTS